MAINIKMNDKSIESVGLPKRKSSKKKKFLKILAIVVLLLGSFILFNYFLGEKVGLQLAITDIFMPIKANPTLKKDSSGIYTNALLIGIDTRTDNSGLQNTDTIIFVSYNHDKHEVVMISIPRDFFVEVPEQGRYTKINSIYAIGERIEEGLGLDYLTMVVEEITNKEIQYYGMVNVAGFVDMIDTVDGIEVDVENSFTDYRYPVEGAEYKHQTVSFTKGLQTMDGKTALRFVRSRMSNTAQEGSDFARARRQQRVILALRDKVFSTETLLNPQKVLSSLSVFEKNISYSDFTNEELQAAIKIFKKDDLKTYSFVLDPSIARFELITDKGLTLDAYAIGPKKGLSKYEEIHKFLNLVFEKPLLYSEDPDILVYDVGIGNKLGLEKAEEFTEQHPHVYIRYMGTLLKDIEGDFLYKGGVEENDLDEKISKYFDIEMTEKPEFMEGKITNGDYIILLGINNEDS